MFGDAQSAIAGDVQNAKVGLCLQHFPAALSEVAEIWRVET